MSYRNRNHFKLRNSTEHQVVIIELVMDRKGRFDLTDAAQGFKMEVCITSACHVSVRVEYWQEWVKEFEMVFVNSFFTKKYFALFIAKRRYQPKIGYELQN